MKLTVKTLKGSHFEIRVQPSDTIMAVKKHIEDVQGKDNYPCGQQLLIHNGKVLKDESTLVENKVSEDGFLVVMLSKSKTASSSGTTSAQPSVTAANPTPAPEVTPPSQAPKNVASASDAAAASLPTDDYSQAASNLVAGNNLEQTIQQIMDMGGGSWDKETVTRALRAAYNNPERAVDYLYSGIPETAEVAAPVAHGGVNSAAGTTAAPTAPSSGGPNSAPLNLFPQENVAGANGAGLGSLDFLRNNQQFQALRSMVQANPQILQPMLQELGKQNPQLLRSIQEHHQEFLQLINEPVDGSDPLRHHTYAMEIHQIAQLLNQTLSPDGAVVHVAMDALDRLSTLPNFPFSLLSIATGGENGGQKVAGATYLKNFIRRRIESTETNLEITKAFRDALVCALLQAEPTALKVLVEAFRSIVAVEFVKKDSWPELVPELRSVIQRSDLIDKNPSSEWKTINALTILHSLIRPFQYFLNPKLAKEPVPPQLELITREILVPLLAVFHLCIEEVSDAQHTTEMQTGTILLIICKCVYLAVRSHMPSALAPLLPSICQDLIRILNSLSLNDGSTCKDGYSLRMKTAKRSLLIFCALISRHRKFADKLMPDMVKCVSEIVKHSKIINKLDSLSERIISLAFDVISRVLETGPGWRLVSPHFSSLLNYAIFPALVMNEKDTAEWEEDPDEYIRKNLPSDLEEISGWRDDLFTARKSALNLLGVISLSMGPPVKTSTASSKRKKGDKHKRKGYSTMGELLVLPYLSKFPVPTDNGENTVNEYYGVLMAYSSLLDFLTEQKPGFVETLVRTRVLPLYETSIPQPYLIASANWVLGELASCLSDGMSADIYSSLVKALTMSDIGGVSSYPVRVTTAAAIAQLVENEYMPPEWLPLLQVVCHRIGDEEEDSSIYFQLLSTMVEAGNEKIAPHIPDIVCLLVREISKKLPLDLEPWPQMVEQGFASLAVMAQCWEDSASEENEQDGSSQLWRSGQATMMRAFSDLLQHAWLRSALRMEPEVALSVPPASCVDDCSTLLGFILQGITETDDLLKLKVSELMLVWSDLIADWHAWEEIEDLSIFNCIKKAVSLDRKFALKNFLVGKLPLPPAPQKSILEGIGAFITEAFSQYPSAVWRAASCVHILLHNPSYLPEGDDFKQSLVISLCHAAFSRFRELRSKAVPLWKPLLLAIASCYLCFPDMVENILEGIEHESVTVFLSALAIISTSKFEHSLSSESEIKLAVMTLAQSLDKLIVWLNEGSLLLHDCVASLMEAFLKLKELEEEEDEESEDQASGDEETEEDDEEDSEDDELEETEEEFLERCAKTAVEMENGTIVEGDVEDQEQEIELGCLEDVDLESTVLSVIERYHQVLLRLQLPPELTSSFLEAFPQCKLYFQQPQL